MGSEKKTSSWGVVYFMGKDNPEVNERKTENLILAIPHVNC